MFSYLELEDDFSIPLCSVGWGGVTRFILLDSTVPGTGHLIGLSTTPTRTRTHWIPTLSWPSQRKGKFGTTSNIYMQSLHNNFVLSKFIWRFWHLSNNHDKNNYKNYIWILWQILFTFILKIQRNKILWNIKARWFCIYVSVKCDGYRETLRNCEACSMSLFIM